MKTLSITKSNFTEWYFNTGCDQDQNQTRIDLGYNVVEKLFSEGKFSITIEDIFNRCEHTVIPCELIVELANNKDYADYEIGEVDTIDDFELVLIDDYADYTDVYKLTTIYPNSLSLNAIVGKKHGWFAYQEINKDGRNNQYHFMVTEIENQEKHWTKLK